LLTERPGRLRLATAAGLGPPLSGLPSVVNLLDVALDYEFQSTRTIYFSAYRADDGAIALEVWKARLDPAGISDAQRMYRSNASSRTPPILSSGRLLVLGPEHLLVAVSDRSDRLSLAQDPNSHFGKIVELRESHPPEVVAFGVRNVQGLARTVDGEIYFTDHGPIGGDELNRLTRGSNYGWPIESAGIHDTVSAVLPSTKREVPLTTWSPSIAPSSLAVSPNDSSEMFVSSLSTQSVLKLKRVESGDFRESTLLEIGTRVRHIQWAGNDLLVLTDGINAQLLKVARPAGCMGTVKSP
jgi:glucose/arabinose dehydrogenase